MTEYRKMTPADIPGGIRLCRLANWNQVERDWELFLKLGPDAARVAVSEGKLVGTVTTISYQHAFSWIGMVLVDPANQRQGIGLNLLREALDILRSEETVKLDATPAGRVVYLKLDFKDEYSLSRMGMVVKVNQPVVAMARPVLINDLAALAAFDQDIFGASRLPLLEWMWEAAPQYAFLVERERDIVGYCMARQGHHFLHIGPVVALDTGIAKNLVSTVLSKCGGKSVIVDAMHFDQGWLAWLRSVGFTEQRPFIRMYRGSNRFPGIPGKQFAIMGPEFG